MILKITNLIFIDYNLIVLEVLNEVYHGFRSRNHKFQIVID